jgi:glutamate-ammonia-ligase adenylyltransferase
MGGLAKRLAETVAGTVLAGRLASAAQPLLERWGSDTALRGVEAPVLGGLARAIASQPETAKFLSHRSHLLERVAAADAHTLAERTAELAAGGLARESDDLEGALDELRLLRREETCLAACLHHSGLVSFEEVSEFLSILAEVIAQRALELAQGMVRSSTTPLPFSVIGMGKIAGREFTYHSDLDLLFLVDGGPEAVADASRIGQRLISYLTTMTGAGVAYPVDTRLRPSGRQGMLVTTLGAFERYQCERAQTWEHVALLRARAIAGGIEAAETALHRVRTHVMGEHPAPWAELSEIRHRVESERGGDQTGERLRFKTGGGGLMDVDFLAGGALLERHPEDYPAFPSVPAMLRTAARGPRIDGLLVDHALLRRVEANARWIAGRGVESLPNDPETLAVAAELLEPGLPGPELHQRVSAALGRIRRAYRQVVDAGTIAALEG